jgi:endonuclease/exonuclease/phosphatase family metal-dependent hydrolase
MKSLRPIRRPSPKWSTAVRHPCQYALMTPNPDGGVDDRVLTVMTLNLWGANRWDERRSAVVDWINEVRPDFVALQEVVRSNELCQASWIAERTEMVAEFAGARHGADGEFGNAVLSRWPVAGARSRGLGDGGSGNEPRAVLTVDADAYGRRVSLSSTHLSHLFDEGWLREQQVLDIAEFVSQPTTDFPLIVCGDFNATPDSTEIRFMKGLHSLGGRSFHLFDAFEVANPNRPGITWSNANPFAATNLTPDQRIDYIFVGVGRPDGAGRVVSARVACDEPRGDTWPSDHFGVVAELSCPSL